MTHTIALWRFHLRSSTRVTWSLITFQLVVLAAIVWLQPPEVRSLLVRSAIRSIAEPGFLSWARLGFGAWALAAAAWSASRLEPALTGWNRHLPVDSRGQWTAAVLGVASGLPHLAILWTLCWVGAYLLGVPDFSAGSLVALPLVILGAASASTRPAATWARLLGGLATVLAASARPAALVAAGFLLACAYVRAGWWSPRKRRPRSSRGRRFPPFGQLLLSLRALGPLVWAIYPCGLPFVLVAGVALRNNVLSSQQSELVLRLGTSLAGTAAILAGATLLSRRRPYWVWARSLAWSSQRRTDTDSALLFLLCIPFLPFLYYFDAASGLSATLLLCYLSFRVAGWMRNSSTGLTRLGPWSYCEAGMAALLTSLEPLTGLGLAVALPFVRRLAGRREQDLKVSLFLERREGSVDEIQP